MRNFFSLACAMILAVGVVLALAGGQQAAAQEYLVQPDDRLRIKIYQIPELAGDYLVSPSGTLSIAPIGAISVAGLSLDEVASRLSEYLIKRGLSQRPGVSVEMLQARPIYVLGDVQRPGEYPFRPGLSVLQAVSLAGGYFRFADPGLMRLERDSVMAKGDLRSLSKRLVALEARRARLSAELAGTKEIAFSPDLLRKAESDLSLKQLLNEERSFLSLNRTTLEQQLENLDHTINLYLREITTIEAQIKSEKLQLAAVQREMSDVKSLSTKGLTTTPRQTLLERTQAQIMSAEQGLQALILRARQSIATAEQRKFDIQSERRSRLNTELQQTRFDIDDVQTRIETARSLIVEAETIAPDMARRAAQFTRPRNLSIIRMINGQSTTIPAREGLVLQPGDVLRVDPAMHSGIVAAGRDDEAEPATR